MQVEFEIRGVHVYARQVDEQTLTFFRDQNAILDRESGSEWQMERGVAIAGPLRDQAQHTLQTGL